MRIISLFLSCTILWQAASQETLTKEERRQTAILNADLLRLYRDGDYKKVERYLHARNLTNFLASDSFMVWLYSRQKALEKLNQRLIGILPRLDAETTGEMFRQIAPFREGEKLFRSLLRRHAPALLPQEQDAQDVIEPLTEILQAKPASEIIDRLEADKALQRKYPRRIAIHIRRRAVVIFNHSFPGPPNPRGTTQAELDAKAGLALELFEYIQQLDPEFYRQPVNVCQRAVMLRRVGRSIEALEIQLGFREADDEFYRANEGFILKSIGKCLEDAGALEEAITIYRRVQAIRDEPGGNGGYDLQAADLLAAALRKRDGLANYERHLEISASENRNPSGRKPFLLVLSAATLILLSFVGLKTFRAWRQRRTAHRISVLLTGLALFFARPTQARTDETTHFEEVQCGVVSQSVPFKVRWTPRRDLGRIKDIVYSCGCTLSNLRRGDRVLKGRTIPITIDPKGKQVGKNNILVTLYLMSGDRQILDLEFTYHPEIVLDPQNLFFWKKAQSRVINLYNIDQPRLESVHIDPGDYLEHRDTKEKGGRFRAWFSVKPGIPLRGKGVITIAVKYKGEAEIKRTIPFLMNDRALADLLK